MFYNNIIILLILLYILYYNIKKYNYIEVCMKFLATHENAERGRSDFPLELYNIGSTHARYQMPFHWHIECEIIYIISGKFSLTLNDNVFILNEGESVFIPGGIIHGGTPENCVYQCAVFSLEKMLPLIPTRQEQYERELGQGDYIPPVKLENINVIKLFDTLKNKSYGYEFASQGLIFQIIGEILAEKSLFSVQSNSSADTKRIKKIKDVLRLIRKDYAKPLTLGMLADTAELNLQYLCKSFKRITGKTPIDYLNFYRIECAAELLQLDEMNVTEIAFACGFNDLSYFIKLFKKQKLMSPREFKKQLNNKA